MKITFKSIAEHLLFAANVFIVFLLVFSDKIDVPYWLVPFGRMHPLVLHFPIVLLFLAMLMEFFRFKAAYVKEQLYQNFTSGLLLSGTLFSALTVIMGLFLAREDGYSGSLLQWHKWTGVSIVFVASIVYWFRNASWYKVKVARLGAILITFCLIAAGHYGASLTHGENFILEPVTLARTLPKIPVEQAKIFDDVILPIFSQKCLSCHNLEKAKGGLRVDNLTAMLKGGKSGKLFVAGNPKISLLLERIHLPEDDKKHMPPRGKNQLTDEEIALLNLWIKENAETKKKVIDLPAQDSLRILATTFLAPAESSEENYDFDAADNQTIEKLNNNYRGVYTLAKGSPALAVNIYNKNAYSPNVLKELEPIKRQIVSLDVKGMPLKDDELKTIAQFENLRTLNLNFTNITGSGLKALQALKFLDKLSISGTKLNPVYLKDFGQMRSLKKLVVWNAGLSEANITQLQKGYPSIKVVSGFKDNGKHPIMLNRPSFKTEVTVFKSSLSLAIKHPINGVQIRYTTDGSEPDSVNSTLYQKPLVFKENTTIKAKAYKDGWYGSETVRVNVYKSSIKADTIAFLQGPDIKYKAGGSKILADGQLGDFETNSGKWLGFKDNNMEALLVFKKPVLIQSVALNVMRHVPTYIFPPVEVEVWGGSQQNKLRLLGKVKPAATKKGAERELIKVETKFKPQNISFLKIVAKNLKKLPDWHPGKGEPAWIFVDEVFLN
ncbi:FN3 associated domain-containing protein [Pedobacter endophyticus]|uniref:Chitobiase/beta-hexosaminidase C-terminal domain-containing protein n=1 Tax=Pedobacter endophyticus TaxID=2789740 RepID=A0A7S9KYG8_9SPHI|nr:FN3 associated domain-containing protein [Pedobacter endophyticus]QPH39189.1 chitobiase/beta-hexosaminidase C-terminal domain-containing protein [Pedobacter endophyticus]